MPSSTDRPVPGGARIASRSPRPGDYRRGDRWLFLCLSAVLLGTLGSFAGWVLLRLIALVINAAYYGRPSVAHASIPDVLGPLSIVVPVLGGLLVGIMARYGSSVIRGHGIPEAMESIQLKQSRIPFRVAWLKPLASAISIGTGGPFGAEGPIIVTGSALGSVLGQILPADAAERKILLASGAVAGMTVIFGTPLAAVFLAFELLLFEWKPRAFVPPALAAVTAAAWRPLLIGARPLFLMKPTPPLPAAGLLCCLAVGVGAGLLAIALTRLVYVFEDLYGRLRLHWMWWPALGGLLVGCGGLLVPRALGVGYRNIRALVNGGLGSAATVKLFLGKALIWAVALGSGTAGGTLAPLAMVGAACGRLLGHALPVGTPALWALVMMAGVVAAALRAPLTAILFGCEVTGNFGALPALLLGCAAAHLVGVLLIRRSIMTEKLEHRGHDIRQELVQDPFETMRARDLLAETLRLRHLDRETPAGGEGTCPNDPRPPVVGAHEPAPSVLDRLGRGGATAFRVVDEEDRRVLGEITAADLLRVYGARRDLQEGRAPAGARNRDPSRGMRALFRSAFPSSRNREDANTADPPDPGDGPETGTAKSGET